MHYIIKSLVSEKVTPKNDTVEKNNRSYVKCLLK